jgi:hypothetical protein
MRARSPCRARLGSFGGGLHFGDREPYGAQCETAHASGKRLSRAMRTVSLVMRCSRDEDTLKAVVLAGGLGTRLSGVTQLMPKSMVEIGGYPISWHRFTFLGEQLEEYVNRARSLGLGWLR